MASERSKSLPIPAASLTSWAIDASDNFAFDSACTTLRRSKSDSTARAASRYADTLASVTCPSRAASCSNWLSSKSDSMPASPGPGVAALKISPAAAAVRPGRPTALASTWRCSKSDSIERAAWTNADITASICGWSTAAFNACPSSKSESISRAACCRLRVRVGESSWLCL